MSVLLGLPPLPERRRECVIHHALLIQDCSVVAPPVIHSQCTLYCQLTSTMVSDETTGEVYAWISILFKKYYG